MGRDFGDDVMAAALIDRLVYHCSVGNIRGNGYRLRQHGTRLAPPQRPPRPPATTPGGLPLHLRLSRQPVPFSIGRTVPFSTVIDKVGELSSRIPRMGPARGSVPGRGGLDSSARGKKASPVPHVPPTLEARVSVSRCRCPRRAGHETGRGVRKWRQAFPAAGSRAPYPSPLPGGVEVHSVVWTCHRLRVTPSPPSGQASRVGGRRSRGSCRSPRLLARCEPVGGLPRYRLNVPSASCGIGRHCASLKLALET